MTENLRSQGISPHRSGDVCVKSEPFDPPIEANRVPLDIVIKNEPPDYQDEFIGVDFADTQINYHSSASEQLIGDNLIEPKIEEIDCGELQLEPIAELDRLTVADKRFSLVRSVDGRLSVVRALDKRCPVVARDRQCTLVRDVDVRTPGPAIERHSSVVRPVDGPYLVPAPAVNDCRVLARTINGRYSTIAVNNTQRTVIVVVHKQQPVQLEGDERCSIVEVENRHPVTSTNDEPVPLDDNERCPLLEISNSLPGGTVEDESVPPVGDERCSAATVDERCTTTTVDERCNAVAIDDERCSVVEVCKRYPLIQIDEESAPAVDDERCSVVEVYRRYPLIQIDDEPEPHDEPCPEATVGDERFSSVPFRVPTGKEVYLEHLYAAKPGSVPVQPNIELTPTNVSVKKPRSKKRISIAQKKKGFASRMRKAQKILDGVLGPGRLKDLKKAAMLLRGADGDHNYSFMKYTLFTKPQGSKPVFNVGLLHLGNKDCSGLIKNVVHEWFEYRYVFKEDLGASLRDGQELNEYICGVCGRDFMFEKELRAHLRLHPRNSHVKHLSLFAPKVPQKELFEAEKLRHKQLGISIKDVRIFLPRLSEGDIKKLKQGLRSSTTQNNGMCSSTAENIGTRLSAAANANGPSSTAKCAGVYFLPAANSWMRSSTVEYSGSRSFTVEVSSRLSNEGNASTSSPNADDSCVRLATAESEGMRSFNEFVKEVERERIEQSSFLDLPRNFKQLNYGDVAKCCYCGLRTIFSPDFPNHLAECTIARVCLMCQCCGALFLKPSHGHREYQLGTRQSVFSLNLFCIHCPAQFCYRSEACPIAAPKPGKMKERSSSDECEYCNVVFEFGSELLKHIRDSHVKGEKDRTVTCSFCSHKFSNGTIHRTHVNKCHKPLPVNYTSPVNSKGLKRKGMDDDLVVACEGGQSVQPAPLVGKAELERRKLSHRKSLGKRRLKLELEIETELMFAAMSSVADLLIELIETVAKSERRKRLKVRL